MEDRKKSCTVLLALPLKFAKNTTPPPITAIQAAVQGSKQPLLHQQYFSSLFTALPLCPPPKLILSPIVCSSPRNPVIISKTKDRSGPSLLRTLQWHPLHQRKSHWPLTPPMTCLHLTPRVYLPQLYLLPTLLRSHPSPTPGPLHLRFSLERAWNVLSLTLPHVLQVSAQIPSCLIAFLDQHSI